jgi:hypothetical protein
MNHGEKGNVSHINGLVFSFFLPEQSCRWLRERSKEDGETAGNEKRRGE